MTQALVPVALFLVLLALLPLGVRWWQRRSQGAAGGTSTAAKIVSAVAVGPQQRVVTVEVGPEGARTWLVLGVTAQSITCLHTVSVGQAAHPASRDSVEHAPTPSSS